MSTMVGAAQVPRRVRRTLDDAGCALTGARVLALCSGGSDSVALVALLGQLPRGAAPRSIDVLWVDHGVRDDVDAERQRAAAAAASIGAGFHERRVTVAGPLEGDLREARYAAALELARDLGCTVVCTGHSASDQAEQVLLSLIGVTGRGAGVDAMPVERDLDSDGLRLVRPLLGCSREELERACADAGLAWVQDPSNLDTDIAVRNAIRHDVVAPLLAASPGAGAALVRAGEHARERIDSAGVLADALLDAWDASERLDVRRLAAFPPGARRELLARWIGRGELGRGLTSRIVRAVDGLATLPARAACSRVDLPGGTCVRRDGYDLAIVPAPTHGGSQP